MSEREIQLLAIGFQIGATAMLLLQILFSLVDDRRDRRATKAALAKLEAARERADA
ncbi:hypothetical protein ACFVY9_00580 [Streptomyces sp. NPDC059544]|uniref:hypothetical protein n=1 Tax=Streptomyces sp. NPDC059544 TaxID=3346861 RepID=UPI0036818BA6